MLIDIRSRASERELRWFAGLWFPALCLMVGWFALRRNVPTAAYVVWIAGASLSIAGLARPAIIQPVYRGLIWLTFPIGWVVSHVILLVLYYAVITPIGVLVRMFFDPLERRFESKADSYWFPRESAEPRRYFRQF
jgi:hypothetical protein